MQIQDEARWLRIRSASGSVERRRVQTGTTTLTKVEITSGLRSGEEVLLAADAA